ncbi:NAD(P)-binding protein [Westerdykella ornata]|uniref:NAD(P)-binding protein n=1 Tax=Westerdykella ornata TaxID=318751 RepID=A0A6A6JY03_WESOR|nr:NAD(P)-binding protein [Westerdykella ornata]KAF2280963.1 NAD(P)-binding protein [Westerdykella ornata]
MASSNLTRPHLPQSVSELSIHANAVPRPSTPKSLAQLSPNGPLPVFRLSGLVALITGGAGKIGHETARRLLREGANVCLVDISAEALRAVVEDLKNLLQTGQAVRSRILTIVADVTVEQAVEEAMRKTVAAFGRLDTAFLGAGVPYASHVPKSIFETTEEDYEKIMPLNVKSAFLGLKHAALVMRELGHGGSIILASSIVGLRGSPGYVLDATSKAALNGLAATAANELGPYGIRVNTIHPSGLASTISETVETQEELESMKNAIPLGRFARVDDIASVVAFLASEDSKFMTGGDLKVDGGILSG